ncbi:MAG TPA: hypothetical protein VKG86_01645 [Terracidiphilus sp.]|nr:hypothetical protein [Terracidiphilus sp.]
MALVLCCAALAGSSIALPGQQANKKAEAARQAHSHAHELSGFLLRQDRKAIEAALGKPFHQEKRSDNITAYAYHLHGFNNNYLVAFLIEDKKSIYNDKIVQMELTGPEPSGPTGFFGLALGDTAEEVESILGKPATISHEDDVNVDLWDYPHENYSLEFTPSHKLYSIQIEDEPGGAESPSGGTDQVHTFARATKDRDMNTILSLASGEIECSQKEAFGIQGGNARKILEDEASPISVCLAKAADAIWALGPEMKGAETNIRIWEKAPPGMVIKFPENSPLREVVFVDEAGAPRIYEVTFR